MLITIKPKPLHEVKAAKLAQLEQSRDAETVKDVTAHGTQWQADERSQKLLSSAITLAMAGAPLPVAWRDTANNNLPIGTLADLMQIAGAMAVQTQAAYVKFWELKKDVSDALTAEDIERVVW